MVKTRLNKLLDKCFAEGIKQKLWTDAAAGAYNVENPKQAAHGDFATNMAMVIAGKERKNPRMIAAELVNLVASQTDFIDKVEMAGPGFINMFIRDDIWQSVLPVICEKGSAYGMHALNGSRRVLVEFVSANPTGPLSVGHGRQAVLGDVIARLLEATGHEVTREYYYNNAGRQMRVLGESTRARYLELLGRPADFPEDGYQGEYIIDIAREILAEAGDSLQEITDVQPFKEKAERAIFADINGTLESLSIAFDNYYNENSLYENGMIDEVVAALRTKGLIYEQDGAVWFKTTDLGLEQDRVIIKSSGEPTYRLPDIAYHREKFKRGYDWMVDIFGSDHIATVPDVMAGVRALGYDDTRITVVLHQFVTLIRNGRQVKMSTRKANFVTLDELLDEVGADAVRFFFLMRKADSQLDFDLDLATRQNQENPVYYVQYAHARLVSIAKMAIAREADPGPLTAAPLHLLCLPEELRMLKSMAAYPDMVNRAALNLEPHRIIFFLLDLAGQFHSYYNKHKIISDDAEQSKARLWLAEGLRTVFNNGLRLIGVTAPESM